MYRYRAATADGQVIEEKLEADSSEEVLRIIRTRNQKPIRISKEEATSKKIELGSRKIKLKSIVLFTRQLYTMLEAGMTLDRSLDVLGSQAEDRKLRAACKTLSADVQKGMQLSSAMSREQGVFPELLIRMIEAGEATGNLSDVLNRMAIHYEKERKINAKIAGAMVYPIILIFISVVAVGFMLIKVIPGFVQLFRSSGVALPLPTRIVMAVSDGLVAAWPFILIGIVAVFLIFYTGMKRRGFRLRVDQFRLNFRPIRDPMRKIATSRFTRTLSTLISSGLSIVSALENASRTTNNLVVEESIKETVEGVEKGMRLTDQLGRIYVFPQMMVSMVAVGEESGNLESMLSKVADYYDDELEASLQKLVAMIEPVMIVVMGGLIGFIVIAMFFPMFDMVKTVQ